GSHPAVLSISCNPGTNSVTARVAINFTSQTMSVASGLANNGFDREFAGAGIFVKVTPIEGDTKNVFLDELDDEGNGYRLKVAKTLRDSLRVASGGLTTYHPFVPSSTSVLMSCTSSASAAL